VDRDRIEKGEDSIREGIARDGSREGEPLTEISSKSCSSLRFGMEISPSTLSIDSVFRVPTDRMSPV